VESKFRQPFQEIQPFGETEAEHRGRVEQPIYTKYNLVVTTKTLLANHRSLAQGWAPDRKTACSAAGSVTVLLPILERGGCIVAFDASTILVIIRHPEYAQKST